MVPRALAERGSKYRYPSVLAMAEEEADAGSMIDSVIFVTVKSRLAGRKFLTPDMRVSKLAFMPVAARRSVRRLDMDEKPWKREGFGGAAVAGVAVEVSMVMRVVARTLCGVVSSV